MIRILGAGCIALGSGAFGFAMAAASRREEEQLRLLVRALEFMSCELSYRLTPLAQLCREVPGSGWSHPLASPQKCPEDPVRS